MKIIPIYFYGTVFTDCWLSQSVHTCADKVYFHQHIQNRRPSFAYYGHNIVAVWHIKFKGI